MAHLGRRLKLTHLGLMLSDRIALLHAITGTGLVR